MIARAFGYDDKTGEWAEYASPSMIYDAVETIPYRIWALGYFDWDPQIYWEIACVPNMAKDLFSIQQYFSEEMRLKNMTPQYIYCPHHDAVEKIARNEAEYTITEAGCRIEGTPVWSTFTAPPDKDTHPIAYGLALQEADAELPDEAPDAPCLSDEIAPVRWRIFQSAPTEPLTLTGDVAVYSPQRGREWKTLSLTVSMKTRKADAGKCRIRTGSDEVWAGRWTDGLNAWDSMGGEVDIPPIVADAVLDALRESTRLTLGIRPSVLSRMQGKRKIMAYIKRPFDLNAVFLKKFLQVTDAEFDRLFPYEEKNLYQRICRYLNIRPPKSLRRAYTLNPYAIVWYMLFLEWGVRDVNFMRPFFLLNDRVGPAIINRFYFDKETGCVEINDAENWDMHCSWDAVLRYCRLLKHRKGERRMMRWLYRYSAQEFLTQDQQDTLEMFAEYEGLLSEALTEKLCEEGLTARVHDRISREAAELSMQSGNIHELPCDPLCLAAECDVNDYRFRLIQNTVDLVDAGIRMKNCVASYQRRIMDGNSSIFVVRHDGSLVACLELNRARQIVQARGPQNCRLTGELSEVCRLWAVVYDFPILGNDLSIPAAQP